MEQVGEIIQAENKIENLAESLEMCDYLKLLSSDPNPAYELLFAWSIDLQKYAPNLRSHLTYHLNKIGMNDIAYR